MPGHGKYREFASLLGELRLPLVAVLIIVFIASVWLWLG